MVGLALPVLRVRLRRCCCVLVLFPAKNRLERHFGGRVAPLLASFAANTLACTLIELAMGLVLNRPGPDGVLPLWDYSDMSCQLHGPGRACRTPSRSVRQPRS